MNKIKRLWNDIFPLHTNKEVKELKKEMFSVQSVLALKKMCNSHVLNKYEPYKKYESLEEYKKQVYDKSTIIQYHGGRSKPQALHKFLEMSDETQEQYVTLVKRLTKNMKFTCPDDVIYKLNIKLNNTYNFTKIYKKDKGEYWLTPTEAYDAVVNGNKKNGLDCEDISIFKYCCFKTALYLNGYWNNGFHGYLDKGLKMSEDKWRLRLCRVNLIHGENHAMLAWCRGDNNKNVGWFPIESSYHPELFENWWARGVRFEQDNPLYKDIEYTWTDEAEYKRLLK